MMRLSNPAYNLNQVLDTCCKGVTGNNSLLSRLKTAKASFETEAVNYVTRATTGQLHTIQAIGGGDPLVIADLKKSELVNLYETYFRGKEKPARAIYDELLASANEKCPFCGGIGRPRNLDHFLPKSHFPQFSVFPLNLVPSCRDCNMDGKGQGYATTAEKQIIQPYLDHALFFDEQWIFATYTPGQTEPGVVEYFVQPPINWVESNKRRVENHFKDFDIAIRYSIEAAAELSYIEPDWNQISQSAEESDSFKTDWEVIVDRSPFKNHWKRVMYLALIDAL